MMTPLLSLFILVMGGSISKHHNTVASTTTTHTPDQSESQSVYDLAKPMLTLSQFIYDFIDLRKQAKDDIVKLADKLQFDRLQAINTTLKLKSAGSGATLDGTIEEKMKGITEEDMKNFNANFTLLEVPKYASQIYEDLKLYREKSNLQDQYRKFLETYPSARVDYLDDQHLLPEYDCELTYAIAVSDKFKTVAVIFRGTKNKFDWRKNIQAVDTDLVLPGYTENDGTGGLEPKTFGKCHKGFYDYLFGKTAIAGISKGEAIINRLKELFKQNPGYSLKITGHSLGGAMSTLLAFRAAAFDEFRDVTVINVSFASPYVGNQEFRNYFEQLEQKKRLQHLRISNNEDMVPLMPFRTVTSRMKHVGVDVKLFRKPVSNPRKPRISYPKRGFFNEMNNAVRRNMLRGLRKDAITYHSCTAYADRLEKAKGELEKITLDEKYSDPDFTGWAFEDDMDEKTKQ